MRCGGRWRRRASGWAGSAVAIAIDAAAQPAWLPALREDLALYPAAPAADGSPAWHLADPAANRFYLIGWTAFEILSRWDLGQAGAVAEAVRRETTLEVDADDVIGVAAFLGQHHLLEARSAEHSAGLLALVEAGRVHWFKWLLKNYLFFRVPLLRPMALLDRWAGPVSLLWRPGFWLGAAAFAALTLLLLARQWEVFLHTFSGYQGWQVLLSFGAALSAAKLIHELGHACAARHHGCKVPSMGVAFLVMWPVLYTDTNEVWKLASRRARLQVGGAGIVAEMLLAVLASFLWVILPDGGLRASMFFLATSSWLMTLAINASPFMRFDGYFLLADLVGMPNLHQRAFALGRWWLREKLFGFGLAAPEALPPARTRLLVGFAFATWCYRLVVFLSIALLVYHAFFKLLGVLLLLVELGWFIVLPFVKEIEVWWKLRSGMRWNWPARRSLAAALLLLGWLLLPWQTDVSAPAVLMPGAEQQLFAPAGARVVSVEAAALSQVRKGQLLLQLEAPELAQRVQLARIAEANWRRQLGQQSFNAGLLGQGAALQSHWREAAAQLQGALEEQQRLSVRAPFDGIILARNQELAPDSWVAPREVLLTVGDRRQSAVEAYVGEEDLGRLHVGAAARFVPEAAEFGRRDCRIAAIDPFNVSELEEPALASPYGGRLSARADAHGKLLPVASLYRVRLEQCLPAQAPAWRLRGSAHLAADGGSLLLPRLRQLARVLLREAGF